jgi:hypothetical protein
MFVLSLPKISQNRYVFVVVVVVVVVDVELKAATEIGVMFK